LRWCAENSAAAAPCFIFSDRQIDKSRNAYYSEKAYSAMTDALDDLDRALNRKLSCFHARNGDPDTEVLRSVCEAHDVGAVFFNSDVTPFARARDESVELWCESRKIRCDGGAPGEGYTLWPAGSVLTKSKGTVPKSFSAFYSYTEKRPLPSRAALDSSQKAPIIKIGSTRPPSVPDPSPSASTTTVGADSAMERLKRGDFDDYGSTRDDYKLRTTRLSVHLKFGRLDVADVMAVSRSRGIKDLARQLLWREFYYHLAFGYPQLLSAPNAHVRPDRQKIKWSLPDNKKADDWLKGETGQPLVDRAMKILEETGYLHNRLRMIVASYFVRDMGMDWRVGERLLATKLTDYDPAQNSGGWQSMDAQRPKQEIKATTQMKKFGMPPTHP
jgi:deoxyribodipyrimidine photo-lyase